MCAFISCWRCSIYGTVRTKLPLERQAWSFQAWLDVMATHLSLWWPQLILQAGTDPVAVIIEKALVLSNVYLGCIWLHDIWYLFKAGETWCLRVPSGIKWHYLLWRCIKWHQVALAKAAAIYLQKEGCWGGYNRIAFRPRGAAWRCSLWMVNLRGFPSVLLLYVALLAGKCRWVLLTSQARCRSIFQFCSHTTMIYCIICACSELVKDWNLLPACPRLLFCTVLTPVAIRLPFAICIKTGVLTHLMHAYARFIMLHSVSQWYRQVSKRIRAYFALLDISLIVCTW